MFAVQIIYHLHGKGIKENSKNRFNNFLYRFVFSKSNVIHLSNGLLIDDFSNLNLKKCNKYVLENCIFQEVDIKKTSTSVSQKFNILYLANLQESKGFLILLEIVNGLKKNNVDFIMNVVGDFRDKLTEEKTKKYIHVNSLEKYIILNGSKYGNEKKKYFEDANLFLYPTRNDAFPLVILEALSFGLPVIATDEGAISEIINNNSDGFVVTKDDISLMIEKILYLYNDENLLKKFSNNAYNKCRTRFTKEIFENNMHEILNKIMDKNK